MRDDRDFEIWVDEARRADIAGEAAARGAALKRSGGELVGPCPVCGGRDRFAINLKKRVFHCRGCAAGGDVIAMVQHVDSCDFIAACASITGRPSPRGDAGLVDSAERQRREDERRRREAQREKTEVDWRERERRRAYEFWRGRKPLAGSLAEAYLAARGLTVLPSRIPLGFAPDMPFWAQRGGGRDQAEVIHRGPAMLAAITDDLGVFAGLHITWIDPQRTGRKAEIVDPGTGEVMPAKKVRGSKRRAAIRLVDPEGAHRLVVGEGIETVLSIYRTEGDPASAYWSAIDLGHLGGRAANKERHPSLTRTDIRGRTRALLVPGSVPAADDRAIPIPERFDEIVQLGDGDSDRFTTEMALRRAGARWRRTGRIIRMAFAPDGMDFNDILRREVA